MNTINKVKETTRNKRLPNLSSTSMSSVSSTSRKHVRTKEVTPTTKARVKKTKRVAVDFSSDFEDDKDIVDLTNPKEEDLLTGTPFQLMKTSNSLYYTYDPRGYRLKNLPNGYCKGCRCPKNYCADILYGKICNKRVGFLVEQRGGHLEDEDLLDLYQEVYSINVYAHLMRNGLDSKRG